MHYIVLFALLSACMLAEVQAQYFSVSLAAGSGAGKPYSLTGQERITAVRVWEANNNFLFGFQLRFGFIWSSIAGIKKGFLQEIELYDDESIIQLSGKAAHYVQSVVFTTSKGRTLRAGQPSGVSFNWYPIHPRAELRFISGRFHGGITSLQAHWGAVYSKIKALQ